MNKFKRFSVVVLLSAVLAVVVISCKDDDKGANPNVSKAEGVKAGTEMCDCVASYPAPDHADFLDGDGIFDEAGFNQAFMVYATNLGTCPGLLSNYQQYVTFIYEAYDAEAEDPLYSVFQFKNSDFEQGFKEGTGDCMQAFEALFALIPNPKADGIKAGTEMCDCAASYTAPDPADFVDGDGNFDEAGFNQAFMVYAGNLGTCPGLLSNYQQYVTFIYEAYDAEAEDPLYSVFEFKDKDFEQGFKEGTGDCMETFAALFALIPQN